MTFDITDRERPLPDRARPTTLDGLVGQDHIWHQGSPLWRLAETDGFHALLLWGPPGTGKTSLANLIANASSRVIRIVSAVHASVKDLRKIFDESEQLIAVGRKSLVLFVDELHRLSKSQQDILLPGIETGIIKFIGATTENPSFAINNAILSRSLAFQLKPLGKEALILLLQNALIKLSDRGKNFTADPTVIEQLADAAKGDARQCLNILDALTKITSCDANGNSHIHSKQLELLGSSLAIRYDRDGDQHYDLASALIKTIRASDPDAAVYYLARMIEGGEDPLFIARRLLISASEDIGNANPTALLVATATFQSVQVLGLPEARIHLSQCTTYLAASPKSNRSYIAINAALADVKATGPLEVPLHIRNAPTQFMKNLGYGKDYAYAHDKPEQSKAMNYMPTELQGKKYYEPLPIGAERQLLENLRLLRPKDPTQKS